MDAAAHVREGWSHGEMRVQRCEACGQRQFPPRAVCLACRSDALGWDNVSPHGTIVTFTIVHRAPTPAWKEAAPYAIALVDLTPGVRMMMNVQAQDFERLAIGAAVEIAFAPTPGDPQPRPLARIVV